MDDLDLQLDDVVLFELPSHADTEAFTARLRSNWPGWSEEDGDVWLFTAELTENDGDLARLLVAAREIVAELGLTAIRFCLDARVYVLEAAAPAGALTA